MPRSANLHGSAPDNATAAVLILDLISNFDFIDGARLRRSAAAIAPRIAKLKQRARKAGIPTIYVNDNFGRWRSDRSSIVADCLQSKGRKIIEAIAPDADDYFILKPKHSGFYSTPLHTLLDSLGARTLILTGVTSHQCVLFTATDAYVRDFQLIIPSDCIAAMQAKQTRAALDIFRTALKAKTEPSHQLKLPRPR